MSHPIFTIISLTNRTITISTSEMRELSFRDDGICSGQTASWVQFSRSVVSDSLRPHESQHARPPCPSPTSGVHSDSRPSSHLLRMGRTDHFYSIKIHMARSLLGEIQHSAPMYVKSSFSLFYVLMSTCLPLVQEIAAELSELRWQEGLWFDWEAPDSLILYPKW